MSEATLDLDVELRATEHATWGVKGLFGQRGDGLFDFNGFMEPRTGGYPDTGVPQKASRPS